MNVAFRLHRGLIWAVGALLALVGLSILAAVALDAGYLRGPLVRLLAALIIGEGSVYLESETLDLILRGYPKNVRFLAKDADCETLLQ
jgi:hypothetical protein